MASAAQWVSAARPRTLPAAIAPVLVGSGAALPILRASAAQAPAADAAAATSATATAPTSPAADVAVWAGSHWLAAILALVVALALQVGVNYANDYSDGIRGTDGAQRVGPFRLVGSGAAVPRHVKLAAFGCFAIAAVAGLVLAILAAWWLILVGLACIAAAWYYTGGDKPYGYAGFGELFVFVFFGLVAVLGTTFVIAGSISAVSVILAVGTGMLTCAILVANNLRDIDSDAQTGKRTLAVLLGGPRTRLVYALMVAVGLFAVVTVGFWHPWCLIALASGLLMVRPVRAVLRGAKGLALIPVLAATGMAEFVYAALLLVGFLLG